MKNKFVNHARNLFDRVMLPCLDRGIAESLNGSVADIVLFESIHCPSLCS